MLPWFFTLLLTGSPPGGQGGFIGVHSGGWKAGLDGDPSPGHILPRPGELTAAPDEAADRATEPEWACTLVSIILALNDIGPGDGPTVRVSLCFVWHEHALGTL